MVSYSCRGRTACHLLEELSTSGQAPPGPLQHSSSQSTSASWHKHAGLNLTFYKSRLDDAWSHLFMVQDNARQLRKDFLASLLSNAEHDKEKTKVAKLKDRRAHV